MKLITFTSFKGGAGKTTSLMTIASALLERGLKVACFEADDNQPLAAWKGFGEEAGTWDANCSLFPAADLDQFEASFEAVDEAGFDIALIDTRGGGSDLNQMLLVNADLVVIPTGLSIMEIADTTQTLSYVLQYLKQQDLTTPFKVLANRTPTTRMSATENESMDIIDACPHFVATIPNRRMFADLRKHGHLHLHHKMLLETPSKRVAANHSMVALKEARDLVEELMNELEGVEA